jgi:hypothetical protein
MTVTVRQPSIPDMSNHGLKTETRHRNSGKASNPSQTKPHHLGQGILIGTEWKLTADKMNIILWHKEGRSKPRWRIEGYFRTIGNALVELVRQGIRDSKLADLKIVNDKITQLEKNILRASNE